MNQYIIPGILFCLTLFFAYLFVAGPIGGADIVDSSDLSGKVSYNRLQNLKEQTKVRLDVKKQQALLEQTGAKPILDPEADKKNSLHQLDINEDYGPAAFDVNKRKSASAMTLDQKMDEFLAERQHFDEMEKLKKQEYVRRFVEESKRMGFEVKINDDMEIVSVKKLKK